MEAVEEKKNQTTQIPQEEKLSPVETVETAEESSESESESDEENGEVPIYAWIVPLTRRRWEDDYVRILVKLTDTVESLKQKIQEISDIPAEEMTLEFSPHHNLDNAQPLKFYRIAHSAQLTVQHRQQGEPQRGFFSSAIAATDRQNIPENTRVFNFRDGELPEGVSLQGQTEKWQEEKDGSRTLVLLPKSYLKCDLNFKANQGKLVNDYTIQMDIYLDQLPTKQLSLFSTSYPENKTDGAVFVNEKGSVGTLGEFGSDEVLEKETWTRVVITCGGAWGSRSLCTYINGKRCSTINKPVLNNRDGAFALKTEGVLLFAANELDHMPGVKVRFVDIRRFDLTPKDVAASRYENIVFSLWKKKQEEDEKSRKSKLSLGSIEDAPKPLWQDRSFFGQFCDPFVSNTELEGGLIGPSVKVLSHTLDRLLEREVGPGVSKDEAIGADQSTESPKPFSELQGAPPLASLASLLGKFDDGKLEILRSMALILQRCRDMCKEFDISKGEECLVPFVGAVRKQLSEMSCGDVMVVPGGWQSAPGGHAVMYSVECTSGMASKPSSRLFRFVVSNTGQGLDYHPATAHIPPKIKYKTNLAIDNVEDRRLADDIIWGVLLRLLYSANKNNKPARLYEILIPYLADRPLEACIAETYNDPAIEWRSPQRAGSCYFRCVLEVFHYLMRRKGLSREDAKRVSFAIRYQMILMLENDLFAVKSVRESDMTLIKFSAQQLAYAASKQVDLSTQQIADIETCVLRIQRRLESLPCIDGNSVEPPPQLELELLPHDVLLHQYSLHPFFDRLMLPPGGVDGLAGTPTKDPRFVPLDFLQIPPQARTFAEAVDTLRICDMLCSLLDRQTTQVKNTHFIKLALVVHVFSEVLPVPLPRTGEPLVVTLGEDPEFSTMTVVGRLTRESPDFCLWETPLLYKDQLDLAEILKRITLHFMASSYFIGSPKSFDCDRIVTMGCIMSILDVVLRKPASDIPSVITQVLYQGYADVGDGKAPGYDSDIEKPKKRKHRPKPYGLSLGYFAEQTRTIPTANPALLVTRAAVIEYFQAQKIPQRRQIFRWELGNKPHGPTGDFVSEICKALALVTDRPLHWLCGDNQYMALDFNHPEFTILRDISYFFKFTMATDQQPRPSTYSQFYAKLVFRLQNSGKFDVESMETMLSCESANTDTRFASNARPSNLTMPDPCVTEDDVLHIAKLPDFADTEKLRVGLGQRDAELLLSYLSAPYLRIPLVSALFASEDRLHALQNRKLQQVFTSVLFEPGDYLPTLLGPVKKKSKRKVEVEKKAANETEVEIEWPTDGIPTQVPTPNRQLLATPFGLLINELARSPHAILTPLISLLREALNLDSDNVQSGTLDLVLFIVRTCAQVDSYIATLVMHVAPEKLHMPDGLDIAFLPPCSIRKQLRGVQVPAIDTLLDLWGQLRKLLRGKCRPLLDRSIAHAEKLDNTFKDEDGQDRKASAEEPRGNINIPDPTKDQGVTDENIQLVSKLHAHRLLLYRNWYGPEPLTMNDLGTVASSFIYISTRFSFNKHGLQLGISEHQLFELFQAMRRNMIIAVQHCTTLQVSAIMGKVLALISGQTDAEPTVDSRPTEQKLDGALPEEQNSMPLWGRIAGTRNEGRYTLATIEADLQGPPPVVPADASHDAEVNLQTAQLTLRTSHLRTLDGDIAVREDIIQVFGTKCASMQCARIFNAQHCSKMRLVGRDHTVAVWDSDIRNCVQQNSRLYSPSNLHDTEMWIIPIFEPQRLDMRKQYIETFMPYHLLMPGAPLKASANVVRLELIHPRKGVWKEVFIYRDPPMVNVYEILSKGRIFYRILQYASDARFALREMQERVEMRMPKPWEEWERHASGWPSDAFDRPGSKSIAIERAPGHSQNFAKVQELFIPSRVLYGLVPAALLDRYLFWQDPESNIRGYPLIEESLTANPLDDDGPSQDDDPLSQKVLDKIFIKLIQVKEVYATGEPGICAQISRHPLTKHEKQLYERLILQRQQGREESDEGSSFADLGFAEDKSSDDGQLVLLDLLNAPKGTALYSLSRLLIRVEHLSYCLCWTKTVDGGLFNVDLVELPRLKLSFTAKIDDVGQIRLYSLDYAGMFISNTRNVLSNHLLRGIPSSLLLANDRGESSILVPNVFPVRPVVATCPFSTELVLVRGHPAWNKVLDSPCHLFPVHISMSFVQTPTLSAALYLLLLRFAHRQYDEAVQLVNSCSIDTEFSKEENLAFRCLKYLNDDQHPDAHAVRARVSLAVLHSPVSLPWLLTQELTMYLMKLSHVSATCRLSLQEERQLYDKVLEDKTGASLMDTEGPICLRHVRKKLYIRPKKWGIILRPQLVLGCHWQVVKIHREQDGSAGVVALQCGAKNKRFLSSDIGGGFRLVSVESNDIPDNCKLRIREVKFDQKLNLRIVTVQGLVSQKYLKVGNRPFTNMRPSLHEEARMTVSDTVDAHCYFYFGHTTTFELVTPHIKNRHRYLEALSEGRDEAECTVDVCKSTEIADSDSDAGDDSDPGSDDDDKEDKDNAEADQVATRAMGLHDSDGEDEEQKEGKKEAKKEKSESKEGKEGGQDDTASKRLVRGAWPCWEDKSALSAKQSTWAPLLIRYSVCQNLQGSMVLRCFDMFWDMRETMRGSRNDLGFLFLYQMFVGAINVNIRSIENSGHSFASLLLQLFKDCRQDGLMQSILHICARNPTLCAHLPKFTDNRDVITVELRGAKVSGTKEKAAPLDQLFSSLIPLLVKEQEKLRWPLPASHYLQLPKPPTVIKVTPLKTLAASPSIAALLALDPSQRTPLVSDFHSPLRILSATDVASIDSKVHETAKVPNEGSERAVPQELAVSKEDLEDFASMPLRSIGFEHYVKLHSRQELGLPEVSSKIPFDVSLHPQAHTSAASAVLTRLSNDVQVYAAQCAAKLTPKMIGILDWNFTKFGPAELGLIRDARLLIQKLSSTLTSLREQDEQLISSSIPFLIQQVNSVRSDEADVQLRERFVLMRLCGQENFISLSYAIACLLSSNSEHDLRKVNPFLDEPTIATINSIIVATLFRANRVGLINRCIATIKDLIADLRALGSREATDEPVSKVDALALAAAVQKADRLAEQLREERHYISKSPDGKLRYDPRFLVFEFTWNLMLRKKQVQMVTDFMSAVTPEGPQPSSVKQLLMGAGKTTVITPLLAMFLADGKSLIAVVVPPALLESSRAVLRTAFASIMQKRIYTFSCDRGSSVTPKLHAKLLDAVRNRGVVMTTPVSIKSVMLKLLETLAQLLFTREESNPESKTDLVPPVSATLLDPAVMRDEICELAAILRLFRNGRLIMDEVDLILHPLKSELNFPIGPRVPLDFQPMRWQLAIHLIDSVFFAETRTISVGFQESARALQILEKLRVAIEMGYAQRSLLSKPHLVLLNPAFYHRRMKMILAEWAQVWLEAQQMPELSRDEVVYYLLSNSRENDDDDDDESLPDVLSLRRSSSAPDMLSIRRNLPQIVRSKLPVHYRKMLNLARDYLQSYLPHVLQKIDRVSFGMLSKEDIKRAMQADPHMPLSRTKLAVPFIGKDMPSQSSEYAHPDITIALTILAYRYEGLRWTDYAELISALRSRLNNEIGPYNERKSAVTYLDWVLKAGGSVRGHELENKNSQRVATHRTGTDNEKAEKVEVVPLRLLRLSALDQMKAIYKMWKQLPDSIHHYLTEFIFPQFMQHQVRKVSANGQAIGGDMLFLQRFGFSGTPSSLLPRELGACDYEKGADGLMLHTLTSPEVVSYELVPDNWTVSSLLLRIATAKRPQFHALIDTGALVTGLTNKQVAAFLLKHGLEGIEGVVFLDELDRKVILVRSTGRIMQLAQCGISKEKRFSFYDQIHTTGTDIPQALDGVAVQTLGKDMTYRDYSQGAFRMRGIGVGQKVHLLVIPEVRGLIKREVSHCEPNPAQNMDVSVDTSTQEDTCRTLVDISAWLVINTMKAESVQFNQLILQNLANVWRKAVFQTILTSQLKQLDEREAKRLVEKKQEPDAQKEAVKLGLDAKEVQEESEDLTELKKGVGVFRETIDFSVHADLPVTVTFNQVIAQAIQAHTEYIATPHDRQICTEIQKLIDSMVERALTSAQEVASLQVPALMKRQMSYEQGMLEDTRYNSEQLNIEMVQARIQEREHEKDMESEREIEIEKYVDLAYRRDREVPVPWEFSRLAQQPKSAANKHFYPLSQFAMGGNGMECLRFPSDLHVSSNYFDLSWSGDRRIKNATIALDWIPSLSALQDQKGIADYSITPSASNALDMALTWFSGTADATHIRQSTLKRILKAVLGRLPSAAEESMFTMHENGYLVSEVKSKLASGFLWDRQMGRHFVLLSLAEAETIRRIMHLRSDKGEAWVIPETDTVMSLRNLIDDFSVVDASRSGDIKCCEPSYQQSAALQSMRFFDSQMFYKDDQLMSLLRAIQANEPEARRKFFVDVIACRRRVRHKHEETPLYQVLTVHSEFDVLRLHGLLARVQDLILLRGLVLSQAFLIFDHDRNGLLTGSELWGGLFSLGMTDLCATDILQLLAHMDTDRDGNISLPEFTHALRRQLDTGTDDPAGSSLVASQATVEPRGAAELLKLQKDILATKLELEEKEKKKMQGFERMQKFQQQRKLLQQSLCGGPNPRIRDKYGVALFDLSQSLLPVGAQTVGKVDIILDSNVVHNKQDGPAEPDKGGDLDLEASQPKSKLGLEKISESKLPASPPNVEASDEKVSTERKMSYVVQQLRRPHSLAMDPQAYIFLPIPFAKNGGGRNINLYSITLVFNLDKLPEEPHPLLQTNKGNDEPAQLYFTKDGDVVPYSEINRSFSMGRVTTMPTGKLKARQWQVMTVTVDSLEGRIVAYIDGEPLVEMERQRNADRRRRRDFRCDGSLSISGSLLLFASSDKRERVNVRLKTAHFATQVYSPSEVRVLSSRLTPVTTGWTCKGCEFHNPSGTTHCQRCHEAQKFKGKTGKERRCFCGMLVLEQPCPNCGSTLSKKRRNPRTWLCSSCRSNNLAFVKACSTCGTARKM